MADIEEYMKSTPDEVFEYRWFYEGDTKIIYHSPERQVAHTVSFDRQKELIEKYDLKEFNEENIEKRPSIKIGKTKQTMKTRDTKRSCNLAWGFYESGQKNLERNMRKAKEKFSDNEE